MIVINSTGFESLLGYHYGILLDYRNGRKTDHESIAILKMAHQMLKNILEHHHSYNINVSEKTIYVFNETIKLLLEIIKFDFKIDELIYDKAIATRMFLRALKAFEITPPDHYVFTPDRWDDNEHENSKNEQAIHYSSTHIKEYSIFIYNLAKETKYIRDPFKIEVTSDHLNIYSDIKSLTTSYTLISNEKPQGNTK